MRIVSCDPGQVPAGRCSTEQEAAEPAAAELSTQGSSEGHDRVVDTGVGSQPDLAGGLDRLWAPYRSAYLADRPKKSDQKGSEGPESPEKKPEDPFLDLPNLPDEEALIVARGEEVFCVLNLFPYNPGHMMVIPYRQVAKYEDLTMSELTELATFTQHAIKTLRLVSGPDAINVGMNLGRPSGGSVPTHLHQHIVPRWIGDTSFMTVIAGAKVLPQTLRDTRALLSRAWRELEDQK